VAQVVEEKKVAVVVLVVTENHQEQHLVHIQ
jgi:hypothetical protein